MIETERLKETMLGAPSPRTWFESYISQERNEKKDWDLNLISKTALGSIVLLRNSCFIPLNLEMPYPQFTAGIWATGNVLALSGLDYWAGSRFIDDLLPQEEGLGKLFPKETTPLRTAAHMANFVPALLSQIPAVYAGTQYNDPSLRIPIGIVVFLGGSVIPLRSIQLSIEKYFNKAEAKKEGIDTKKQQNFLSLLRENRQRFITMTAAQKEAFIDHLEEIREIVNPSERLEAYLNHLLFKKTITQEPRLTGIEYSSSLCITGLGYALSGIYQYANGVYTFEKTKQELFDNNLFAGVMAPLVVGASLYLTGSAIVNSSVKLFHSVTGINKEFYASQETISENLRKKTLSRLQALGHIINILALGVSYVIWKDFFKDKNERLFFEATLCLSVFLLLHASTPPVIDDFVEWSLSKKGTAEEKKAIKMAREYQNLIHSIDTISPKNFEEVSEIFPENLLAALNNETKEIPFLDPNEISMHILPYGYYRIKPLAR